VKTPKAKFGTCTSSTLKNVPLENVLVTSKGYGEKDGEQVKTSTLRHSFPLIEANSYKLIEPIDEQTFGSEQ
jgi:hypothetical protein